MKKIISYVMISICCLGLTGCASFPNLAEEDMDLVAEYAAGLLLKYSATAENRLVDVEDALLVVEEKQEEALPEPDVEDEIPDEIPEEPQEEVKENETPVTDNTETVEETLPSQPMNQVLGLGDIEIHSNGYEIKDSYPDGTGSFFALDAGDGCKLVVMKYTLSNNSTDSIDINMLGDSITYKVALDGSGYKYALSTLLLDDLSTYVGKLDAGASVDLVLISEWKEEEISNISNLTLYIQSGDMKGTYQIQ